MTADPAPPVVAPYPRFDGSQRCAELPLEVLFPESKDSTAGRRSTDAMVRMCGECPFVRPCLAYALTHDVHGWWAGTTRKQRAEHRREHGIYAAPVVLEFIPQDRFTVGRLDEDGHLTRPDTRTPDRSTTA